MALHSFTFICIHLTWAVENHQKILTPNTRRALADHLLALGNEIKLGIINLAVQADHVHILYDHPTDLTIASVAKSLKGESSRWINENDLVLGRFRWQRGYGAFSVSKSNVSKVIHYIQNQDEHHRHKSYLEEYQSWIQSVNASD